MVLAVRVKVHHLHRLHVAAAAARLALVLRQRRRGGGSVRSGNAQPRLAVEGRADHTLVIVRIGRGVLRVLALWVRRHSFGRCHHVTASGRGLVGCRCCQERGTRHCGLALCRIDPCPPERRQVNVKRLIER